MTARGVLRCILHVQGDNMIGKIIFGMLWITMWIALFVSGLGIIAYLAGADYPLE